MYITNYVTIVFKFMKERQKMKERLRETETGRDRDIETTSCICSFNKELSQ